MPQASRWEALKTLSLLKYLFNVFSIGLLCAASDAAAAAADAFDCMVPFRCKGPLSSKERCFRFVSVSNWNCAGLKIPESSFDRVDLDLNRLKTFSSDGFSCVGVRGRVGAPLLDAVDAVDAAAAAATGGLFFASDAVAVGFFAAVFAVALAVPC